ncbi:hypothetical protein SGPA1_30736 [Streptomyces misionensis JCM 4497]
MSGAGLQWSVLAVEDVRRDASPGPVAATSRLDLTWGLKAVGMATDGACVVLARAVVASAQLSAITRFHCVNIMRGQTVRTFHRANH